MDMLLESVAFFGLLHKPACCFDHALVASILGPRPVRSQDYWRQTSQPVASHPKERHLKNIRQLTFGGQNAEAYWNAQGTKIVYQTRQPEFPDEQIVVMNADGSNKKLVSTGKGRCTCSYFAPDGNWVYFSSTHDKNVGAQTPIDMSKGYVWMVNPQFSLFRVPYGGSRVPASATGPELVLNKDEYVAETTISPDGKTMFFTGAFDGDLEIYRSDVNGKNIRRLTNQLGYDGGPFVSWDGKWVVYRRADPKTEAERADYLNLLKQHLVRPSKLEIYVMDALGNQKSKVTSLGSASFAPFMHPAGKRIIFASNFGDKKGREFELWMIDRDGSNLERVTYTNDFDGFPMFSRDGKKVLWASNRNGKVRGETNIFVADWVE